MRRSLICAVAIACAATAAVAGVGNQQLVLSCKMRTDNVGETIIVEVIDNRTVRVDGREVEKPEIGVGAISWQLGTTNIANYTLSRVSGVLEALFWSNDKWTHAVYDCEKAEPKF